MARSADPEGPAAAPAPEHDPKARARQLFERGQTHYDLGEYDEAVARFREAYELSLAPGLLFNIAQAYRLKGECARALQAYRNFVRLDHDSPHRAAAETQIKDLGGQCGSTGQAAPSGPSGAPSAAVPPAVGSSPVPASSSSAASTISVAAVQPQFLAPPPDPGTSVVHGRIVLGLLSSGIVVAGVATAFHLWNDARYDTWREEDRQLYARPDPTVDPNEQVRRQAANDDLLRSIRRTDTLSVVLGITAGVCIVAGATVIVVWEPIGVSTRPKISQLAWRGSW